MVTSILARISQSFGAPIKALQYSLKSRTYIPEKRNSNEQKLEYFNRTYFKQFTFFNRNNQPLEKSPNITESYDGENIVLEIRNADSEVDAGDYKCIASNPVGKTSHGARVTVDVDTVTFTKTLPKEVVVDEYKTLELTCETSHTVSTKWWHNHKEISGMDHREIIQEGHVHKLVIKKTSTTDEGTYECTVKNQSTGSNVTVKGT